MPFSILAETGTVSWCEGVKENNAHTHDMRSFVVFGSLVLPALHFIYLTTTAVDMFSFALYCGGGH